MTTTICIFGGYTASKESELYRLAFSLGRALADGGFEVLNGGYDGTMEAACKGAREAGGRTIGVTCPSYIRSARGDLAPNGYLDEIIPAADIPTRIDTMIRMSGGFIVLDGGTGTLSELALVWEFVCKGFIPHRPIVVMGRAWDGVIEQMRAHRGGCVKHIYRTAEVAQCICILKEHAVTGTRARALASRGGAPGMPNGGLNDATTTVAHLRELIDRFIDERDWHRFHDAKNLSASIAIEAAELMELFQWLRSEELDCVAGDEALMQRVREEIADVLAYTLSFAETMNIDLSSALADKIKMNAVKYPADRFKGRFR